MSFNIKKTINKSSVFENLLINQIFTNVCGFYGYFYKKKNVTQILLGWDILFVYEFTLTKFVYISSICFLGFRGNPLLIGRCHILFYYWIVLVSRNGCSCGSRHALCQCSRLQPLWGCSNRASLGKAPSAWCSSSAFGFCSLWSLEF